MKLKYLHPLLAVLAALALLSACDKPTPANPKDPIAGRPITGCSDSDSGRNRPDADRSARRLLPAGAGRPARHVRRGGLRLHRSGPPAVEEGVMTLIEDARIALDGYSTFFATRHRGRIVRDEAELLLTTARTLILDFA